MRRNHASLDALGAQWLVNLRARNVASEAVRSRSKQLRVFLAFCASRGVERPRAVLFETLLAYQVHLFEYRKPDGHPLSLITQRERLTAVRVFFRWLLRTGAVDRDVSALEVGEDAVAEGAEVGGRIDFFAATRGEGRDAGWALEAEGFGNGVSLASPTSTARPAVIIRAGHP